MADYVLGSTVSFDNLGKNFSKSEYRLLIKDHGWMRFVLRLSYTL